MNQFGRPTLKMLALISIISLLISSTLIGCQRQQPVTIEDVPPDQIVALGVTHFSGMAIEGTETDELIVDQTSTGDIVEFRDNGTSVWRLADGGAITYAGNQTMTGNFVVNGTTELNGTVTLENDETLVNSTNGTIGVTVQSTGTLNVLTGNLAVGNGTPSTTQNGEDAYVEGMLEVDGAADLDSTLDVASTAKVNTLVVTSTAEINSDITLQNDETVSNSTNGTVGVTVEATGSLNVLTGNLKVGNGTPSATQDGEDGYVEGMLEVDGTVDVASAARVSSLIITGTADIGGDVTLQNDETISNGTNGTVGVTVDAAGSLNVLTGNLRVGNGTPSTTQDGEDAYIEGMLDVDGNAGFEGNLYANAAIITTTLDVAGGDITLQNDETVSNSTNGTVGITVDAAGSLNVLTGNFRVGNAEPSVALNGEDALIEGTLEVGGATTLSSTLNLQNAETIANSTNGTIAMTVQSTGTVNVLTGNLAVGNGTPSTTQDGEDAYIEGMLDVDGNAGFEGNVYLNVGVVTTTLTVGGATELNSTVTLQNDETIVNSTDGTIGVTVQSTGTLNVLTGNLAVGNGTPSTTQDGEDAYVEGMFEVDGGAAFAGNLYANAAIVTTTLTLASATVWITDAGIIVPSATFVKLLSGDTVTMTDTTTPISAGTTTGQLLIMENTNGAYVINIDGTGGNVKCTANIALTALDVVTLLWDGTEWVCLALYVNG